MKNMPSVEYRRKWFRLFCWTLLWTVAHSSHICKHTSCSAKCPAGKYAVLPASCVDCPASTYLDTAGGTDLSQCLQCNAGKYSMVYGAINSSSCQDCASGHYSNNGSTSCNSCEPGQFAANPGQPNSCDECVAGKYTDQPGQSDCETCNAGSHSGTGDDRCVICPAGKYSTLDACVSCAKGLASTKGNNSAADYQSTITSFVAGSFLFAIAVVLLLVYVCFARAERVAFLEQQTSIAVLVHTCTAVSAVILERMQRVPAKHFFWKLCLVLVTFVALFIGMMFWFVTNTFLLSTSWLSPPGWLEQFQGELTTFVESFPLAWFLVIVLPIMRWVRNIDFTFLMVGVRVSCLGAQGPAILVGTVVIVIATVLIINSQFHAMLALALVPVTSLVQMELISAPTPTIWSKASNIFRFAVLSAASALMLSCSRYIMQVFTTLVDYSGFVPYRKHSKACDDDGIDSLLAAVSTAVFYASIIPVVLLMVRVLMPGLPCAISFAFPQQTLTLAKPGQYRRVKNFLDWFNPLKWAMRGLYWLMFAVVGISSGRSLDITAKFVRKLRGHVRSVTRDEIKHQWDELRRSELPGFLELLRILYSSQDPGHLVKILWDILHTCCWKVKLALFVACGVWTDEVAAALEVDALTKKYYGWTQEPMLLHEDVMAVISAMRSMTWMLLPPLIILTKFAEVTNNPPVFVFTEKLHITSPLWFSSWKHAEEVMLEGKNRLDVIHERAEGLTDISAERRGPEGWVSILQHKLRVALVWLLGARVPRYVVQMVLLILAIYMAIEPRMEILMLAACIILLWSLIYTIATLLDVRLMLRLRKEQPSVEMLTEFNWNNEAVDEDASSRKIEKLEIDNKNLEERCKALEMQVLFISASGG